MSVGIVRNREEVPHGFAPLSDVVGRDTNPALYYAARMAARRGEIQALKLMRSAHHSTGTLFVRPDEVVRLVERMRHLEAQAEKAEEAAEAAEAVEAAAATVEAYAPVAVTIDAGRELAETIRELQARIVVLTKAVSDLSAAVLLDAEVRGNHKEVSNG